MKTKKIKTEEGTLFAVPLKEGGYGIGLVARKNKKVLLGYFFKKIYGKLPDEIALSDMDKENIALIARFSSLGIDGGEWPILKSPIVFERDEWPIPIFKMKDSLTDVYYSVVYGEDLLNERKYPISEEEARILNTCGLAGYEFLATKLSRLLKPGVV